MPISEQYRSKSVEQAIAHLVEELTEAATAGAKCLRFGPTSVNPELPTCDQETNFVWLCREMVDVVRTYRELDRLCADEGHLELGELIEQIDPRYV